MKSQKSSDIITYCLITSTTSIVLIFISLIPVSKRSFYWNQCFQKTYEWIDKYEMKLKNVDKISKETVAVASCNGAVYEPKFKNK